VVGRLDVPLGNTAELTKRLLQRRDEDVWSKNLLNNEKAWNAVLAEAQDKWLELKSSGEQARLKSLKPGDIRGLGALIRSLPQQGAQEREIEAWIKDQAWKALLNKVFEEWPELEAHRAEMMKIGADQWEALIGRIQAKGSIYGLAGLRILEPVIGDPALATNMKSADGKVDSGNPEQVEAFLTQYFGPSPRQVEKDVEKLTEGGEKGKNLTVEEVSASRI